MCHVVPATKSRFATPTCGNYAKILPAFRRFDPLVTDLPDLFSPDNPQNKSIRVKGHPGRTDDQLAQEQVVIAASESELGVEIHASRSIGSLQEIGDESEPNC